MPPELESFARIADQLGGHVLLVAGDGRLLCRNRSARTSLPDLPIGADLCDFVREPASFRRYLALAARSAQPLPGRVEIVGSPEPWRCKASALTLDGQRLIALPLYSAADATRRFLALNQQIRQLRAEVRRRRALEQEREELLAREQAARQDADAANKAKDALLASVSHELRTPLHAIQGWVEMLRDAPMNAERRAHAFAVIDRNIRAQQQLTEDLVDLAAALSGRMSLELEAVNLAPLTEQAVSSAVPGAVLRGQTIIALTPPIGCTVNGDPTRLLQVIGNLISNACKYSPDGGTITVELRRELSHAEIIVRDTGDGMSADELPYVFDRFHRASTSTTRRQGGLGIGLSIARHLVELHGGVIVVESEGPGKGSSFIVSIPLPAFAPGKAVTTAAEALMAAPPPHLLGLTILLVEDHEDSRDLLQSALEMNGAQVVAAGNSAEALADFDAGGVDAIISDIEMPDEDGFTMMRKIRALERLTRRAPTPAIALSAHQFSSAGKHAVQAGFQRFITKPVAPGSLVLALTEMLHEARHPRH